MTCRQEFKALYSYWLLMFIDNNSSVYLTAWKSNKTADIQELRPELFYCIFWTACSFIISKLIIMTDLKALSQQRMTKVDNQP
jgi:hypothetical protein